MTKNKDRDVIETADYENMLDPTTRHSTPLSNFVEISDNDVDEIDEWRRHWKHMPDFKNDANPPYKKLIVHFRNEEDYNDFASRLEQLMTIKTKSIWYPALDRMANSLLRWIEDETEE